MATHQYQGNLYICRMCEVEFYARWSKLYLCTKCKKEYWRDQTLEWHELQRLAKYHNDIRYKYMVLPWRIVFDPTGDFKKGARFSALDLKYGRLQHVFAPGTKFRHKGGRQLTIVG